MAPFFFTAPCPNVLKQYMMNRKLIVHNLLEQTCSLVRKMKKVMGSQPCIILHSQTFFHYYIKIKTETAYVNT